MIWNAILLIAALGISIPMLVWSVECAAALLPSRKSRDLAGSIRPRIAVLIPAHNEAEGISEMLRFVLPQLHPTDRAIVIADNCTDATAKIARECGAQVMERVDPERIGKSYALDHGVRCLHADPPDVVLIFDADCIVEAGTVDRLARLTLAAGRPVQASYVLTPPAVSTPQHQLAALGLIVKNLVRARGLDRLGMPCFLNGSGMAFPMPVISNANLANGKIAEDKWMTVDLALAGCLALFSPESGVRSLLPQRHEAHNSQRTRWIHGHLECMRIQAPRLLWAGIRRRRFAFIALALDLLVPPLSLLLLVWLVVIVGSVLAVAFHLSSIPAIVAASAGTLMALVFAGVVFKFAPVGLPGVLAIAGYIALQFPLYVAYLKRRQKKWIRTGRDPMPPA